MFISDVISKLTGGDERTSLIKKNIIGSFSLRGLSILVSFFLVPLTINFISAETYGVWLTIYSIVSWIGLFDIGFGNGLRNKVAESIASQNYSKVRKYIGATYICLTLIFVPIAIILITIVPFVPWVSLLNVNENLLPDLVRSMQIVFLFMSLTMIAKVQSTVLSALQLNAVDGLFDTLGHVMAFLIILFLSIVTKGSLTILALVISAAPLFAMGIGTWWLFSKKFPEYKPNFSSFTFSTASEILNLGVQFFIIQIAVLVLHSATNFLISYVSGPNDVTEYNVVFKYLTIPYMFFGIITAPLWSAYTDAYTSCDFHWMKTIYKKMSKMMYLCVIAVICLVTVYPFFFKFWLGDKIDIHLSMIVVVALYTIEQIWVSLHSIIINGIGKIRLQLAISVFMTTINIPFALLLGRIYGAEGVILSTLILNIAPTIILTIQVRKALSNNLLGIWNK